MAGRRFAFLEVDDGKRWIEEVDGVTNMKRGRATAGCKLWMDACGTDKDVWEHFKTYEGEWPSLEEAKKFDVIVIPGSRHAAYDLSIPWMAGFTQILKEYAENGLKLIGGCFGNQILAIALGGQVGKNPSGKFVLKVEKIELLPKLLDKLKASGIETPSSNSFNALECHGDQVLELPPGAVRLASSATAPNEIWTHGDNVLALQSHPEMIPDWTMQTIIASLTASGYYKKEESDDLYKSLATPPRNHVELNAFIKNFAQSGATKGQAAPGQQVEDIDENAVPENAPPSRTQLMKDEFNRLYASTVSLMDSLPLSSSSMSLSGLKKGMGLGERHSKEDSQSMSEEYVTSPGVHRVREALEKSSKSFFEKVTALMRLELERGFIQYDRLEVANRMAGAEFQKLAEAVKEAGQSRKEARAEHKRVGNDVHQVLDELSDIVSQIEAAVAKLAQDTEKLCITK